MWLISGDTKDTIVYCCITVIAELVKVIVIDNNFVQNYILIYALELLVMSYSNIMVCLQNRLEVIHGYGKFRP